VKDALGTVDCFSKFYAHQFSVDLREERSGEGGGGGGVTDNLVPVVEITMFRSDTERERNRDSSTETIT